MQFPVILIPDEADQKPSPKAKKPLPWQKRLWERQWSFTLEDKRAVPEPSKPEQGQYLVELARKQASVESGFTAG